jgi:phosphoribosyl 1,2-cyclic phosphodiesterase
MSVFFASINSGSNGNCYYIGSREHAILVDAGLSCREIEKRLHLLNLPIEKIRAVFISHEHADHIKGLARLSERHRLPVFINQKTRRAARIKLDPKLVYDIPPEKPVSIGDLSITAFSKSHDAADPYSFIAGLPQLTVGIFTDIGYPCEKLKQYFSICNAAFLEANYDEDMLENGPYPYILKQRIRGGSGHLSNTQAAELMSECRPPFMSHLILSHLSKNNNSPERAQQAFKAHSARIHTHVASRFEPSPVFSITSSPDSSGISAMPAGKTAQLSLDF